MSIDDKDKEWYEFPDAIAGPKLVELRRQLREKNLHDTEEPPLERSTTPTTSLGKTSAKATGSSSRKRATSFRG